MNIEKWEATRPEAKRTLDDWTFALVSVWPKVPEARALKWRLPP